VAAVHALLDVEVLLDSQPHSSAADPHPRP
jgi:hypothetical protein